MVKLLHLLVVSCCLYCFYMNKVNEAIALKCPLLRQKSKGASVNPFFFLVKVLAFFLNLQ